MFKATLAEPKVMRDAIISISEIIDEGSFRVSKEGIRFTAADRAMVAVVDFFISSKAFEKYDVQSDVNIGVNILGFLGVLKRAGTGDKITFDVAGNKFLILIEGKSKRKFVVPMLDLGNEEIPPVDQLEFKNKAQMNSDVLANGISDAQIIGDSLIFGMGPSKFWLLAEGDVSKAELELEKGNEALIEITAEGDSKSRYSLEYLKKMIKAAKISDNVTLELGQDYPLRMAFAAGDTARISFILAPRVQDE
jgi:proliferating cell nuclear antigen